MRSIILCCFFLFVFCESACAKQIKLMLDWVVNPDHAPIFVAEYKGFFKKHGIDVKMMNPLDPSEPPKLVAMKKVDIAIDYQPQFMIEVDRGMPLVTIGTLVATPLDTLVAQKNIHKIEDLKGKRVGYSDSTSGHMMIKTMLKQHGLSLKDIIHINVHYALTQSFLSQRVDAATGMGRNVELIQLRSYKKEFNAFYPEEEGVPPYNELIFIVNKHNAHDVRWTKFMLAIEDATHYLVNHPEEMWKAYAAKYPESNNAVTREIWFATLSRFALRPSAVDPMRWKNFQKFLHSGGLIKVMRPVNSYFSY